MKILYLASKYKPEAYNGTIKFIEHITSYFNDKADIKLVAYCEIEKENAQKYNNISYWKENIDGVECIKFTTKEKIKTNYSLFDEQIYEFALKVINDFNPDLIHICHLRRVYSFIKAAIDLKKRYILTMTDSLLICPNTFLLTKKFEFCKKHHQKNICETECGFNHQIIKDNYYLKTLYLNNASAITAPSKFQADIYREYTNNEITTINHGNDLEKKYTEKVYPKKKLIFGFSGSGLALKGLNILLETFNKLQNIDVDLYVYGNFDDTARLFRTDNVKFMGVYDNSRVSEVLSKMDIFICPSLSENYPFAITESFINAVPVIATNEGGMKELVKNFINGFTFELGNVDQLAQIIKSLYNNQNLISDMRKNLTVYKYQSVQSEMFEYEKIYSMCLKGKRIENNKENLVENIWVDLITKRFDNADKIDKFKDIIINISKKYKYVPSIDMVYRFIARIYNFDSLLKSRNICNIIIWGAGTSGKITIEILQCIFKDINIKCIVDKFSSEKEFSQIPIKDINILENEKCGFIFICTNPGKQEASLYMKSLKKKINTDYGYGMCIE